MGSLKVDIYISDLLYSYDCVIVPDFGGFVANYSSARLNSVQHQIHPPSKRISFNEQLKNNDGLLTNHIAVKNEIPYVEARDLIAAFVQQSKTELQQGDRIKIEKVGTLFLNAERKIQFIAANSTNYLLDSFGLESLRVLPIEKDTPEERIVRKVRQSQPFNKQEPEANKPKRRKASWLPAAAVLAILVVSASIMSIKYDIIDSSGINYSAFRFNVSEKPIYRSRAIDINTTSIINLNAEKPRPIETNNEIVRFITSNDEETNLYVDPRNDNRSTKKDNTLVKSSTIKSDLRFHIIGGCFTVRSNAEKLIAQLIEKGYSPSYLGTYKKYQAVSIGSFKTREDALTLLREVRNGDHPNAWLLIKSY